MPQVPAERRIARAKELRKLAKEAGSPTLKDALIAAADRVERQAAKGLSRLGRPVARRATSKAATRRNPFGKAF